MAKHKARTRRSTLAGVSLAAVVALLAAFSPSPAGADITPVAPGKQVTSKDSHVTGICKMTVQAVNTSTGQVSLRLAAQARPTTLSGYGTNAYTQVFCSVYDAGFNLVATNNPYRNGPTVPNTAAQFVVPYSSAYFLCGQAFVKLNNGNQFLTPLVCA
jgi:hypothetical protein